MNPVLLTLLSPAIFCPVVTIIFVFLLFRVIGFAGRQNWRVPSPTIAPSPLFEFLAFMFGQKVVSSQEYSEFYQAAKASKLKVKAMQARNPAHIDANGIEQSWTNY